MKTGHVSLAFIRTRPEVPPGDPQVELRCFWGRGISGVDSVDLRVPWGRAPEVNERAGWVSLDFIRTRPRVPPQGPQGRTFWGSGQVGVELYRPQGAPG